MAFNHRGENFVPITKAGCQNQSIDDMFPELSSTHLNKLKELYPSWLKNNSAWKRLPGIYLGVLGQVQMQSGFLTQKCLSKGHRSTLKCQQHYLDRFTDTERVHKLLSASRLPNETLATIWAHVNKTFPGRLTNREVCLALALIAIFQRQRDGDTTGEDPSKINKDPFSIIKIEKRPPVPVLYPTDNNQLHAKIQVTTSKSTPDKLNSSYPLIDISGEADQMIADNNRHSSSKFDGIEENTSKKQSMTSCDLTSVISGDLINMDNYRLDIKLYQLTKIWLSSLKAMKVIFKRSFDILNVENSRQSAVEALESTEGIEFSKNLCLCYPMAHNIKFRIDTLNNLSLQGHVKSLFNRSYITQIDKIMTSINEYWAVLINLFHQSEQIKFIETIMDGLNNEKAVMSLTLEELADKLDGSNRADVCSICLTRFYLTTCDAPGKDPSLEDASFLGIGVNELLSDDDYYYYHTKCANFWLNNVDSVDLPFRKQPDENILRPATCN